MNRFEIAATFRDIADWLEFNGDKSYRARAYRRGAAAIHAANAFDTLLAEGRLTSLPGIGDALAAQIVELSQSGVSAYLQKLSNGLPRGLLELQSVLSPAKIVELHKALGIANRADLIAALDDKRVQTVKGFGAKTAERIRLALAAPKASDQLMTRNRAETIGIEIERYLKATIFDCKVILCGAMRRGHETVGEVDILVNTAEPARALATARLYPLAIAVAGTDDTVEMRLGDQELVRIVAATSDNAMALFTMTGPTGYVAGFETTTATNERQIYAAAKREYVPPEFRDQAAIAGALVELDDLRGMVHCHTDYSDGRNTIAEMARTAEALGFSYLTITDHSPTAHYAGGLDIDRLRQQWDEIARVQETVGIRLLRGTECDITKDGALDYDDDILERLDIVIASIHARYKQDAATMTARIVRAIRHPIFKVWGHPLGRILLQRDPVECDIDAIFEAAHGAPVAFEVNGDPYRLDLPPALIQRARPHGIRFVISTDAHSTSGMYNLRHGLAVARRGGLTQPEVLNTLPTADFLNAVRPRGPLPAKHGNQLQPGV